MRRYRRGGPLVVLSALIFVLAGASQAIGVPFFSASENITGTKDEGSSGPVGVSTTVTDFDPFFVLTSASAHAGPGTLGVRSEGAVAAQNVAGGTFPVSIVGGGGAATARMVLDDLIFTGPGSGPVPASLTLAVSGVLANPNFAGSGTSVQALNAGASVHVDGSLFDLANLLGSFFGTLAFSRQLDTTIHTREGIFSSFVSPALLHAVSFETPLGTPVTLDMTASATAGVGFRGLCDVIRCDVNLRAVGDFSSTIAFPSSGPVFDLPSGFTVNSVSGLIVDNRWVGGAQVPVAEPSSLLLLAAGVAGMGSVARGLGRRVKR